jgi:uncharacterized protein (DUF2345 family)
VDTIRDDQMKAMAKSGGGAAVPCSSTPPDAWIEVVLVDQQDKPVADARYRITLTTGEEKIGKLDANGMVRFDKIPEGICLVRFPDLDGASTEMQASPAVPRKKKGKRSWLELKVVDEKGKPQGNLKYEVTLSDETVKNGTLDADGFSRIDDIPAGTCKVRFPGDVPGVLELQSST